MVAVPKFETMSFDDFEELLKYQEDDERLELINGRVIRGMVGARWEHERLAGNIYVALQTRFRAKKSTCRAFKETFFVKKKVADFSVLPDIVVRCGPLSPGQISVDDPVSVFEVLSPSTETRDRYDKWDGYKHIDALQHYVLVHRDKPLVEIRTRAETGWKLELIEDMAGSITLDALDITLSLAEIYEDVLGPAA